MNKVWIARWSTAQLVVFAFDRNWSFDWFHQIIYHTSKQLSIFIFLFATQQTKTCSEHKKHTQNSPKSVWNTTITPTHTKLTKNTRHPNGSFADCFAICRAFSLRSVRTTSRYEALVFCKGLSLRSCSLLAWYKYLQRSPKCTLCNLWKKSSFQLWGTAYLEHSLRTPASNLKLH